MHQTTYFSLHVITRGVTRGVVFLRDASALLCCLCLLYVPVAKCDTQSITHFRDLANRHPDKTGVYVLEKGEESLLARACCGFCMWSGIGMVDL